MKAVVKVCNNFRSQMIPSLFVNTNHQMLVTNVPEQTERHLPDYRIKLTFDSNIVLTNSSVESMMGLPTLVMKIPKECEFGVRVFMNGQVYKMFKTLKAEMGTLMTHVAGVALYPSGQSSVSLGVRQLPRDSIRLARQLIEHVQSLNGPPLKSDPRIQRYLNDPSALLEKGSRFLTDKTMQEHRLRVIREKEYECVLVPLESPDRSVCSFCLLLLFFCETPKLEKAKLDSLQIAKHQVGELLIGKTVSTPVQHCVSLKDVIGEKRVNVASLVIDVQSVSQLESLSENRFLNYLLSFNGAFRLDEQLNTDDRFRLDFVFHTAPFSITSDKQCIEWLTRKDVQTKKNVFLNADFDSEFTDQIGLQRREYFATVSKRFPHYFPLFEGRESKASEMDKLIPNFIPHRHDSEYHLHDGTAPKPLYFASQQKSLSAIRLTFNRPIGEVNKKHQGSIRKKANFDKFPFFVFLGVGSQSATLFRNVSAILFASSPTFYSLMDCGYGTVYQICQQFGCLADEVIMKIQLVVISHFHGDHFDGLLNLVDHRSKIIRSKGLKQVSKLVIMLPNNCLSLLLPFIEYSDAVEHVVVVTNQEVSRRYLPANEIHELEVMARNKSKGVDNIGRESNEASTARYKELFSNSLSEAMSILDKNEITKVLPLPVIHCFESVGFLFEVCGKRIFYSGDCYMSSHLHKYLSDLDLLIHETTFDCSENSKVVFQKRHSNVEHALASAVDFRAQFTCLTHLSQKLQAGYSQKYPFSLPKNKVLLDYFRTKAFVCHDHLYFDFESIKLLPEIHTDFNCIFDFKPMDQ
jgi:ribonuclease Z